MERRIQSLEERFTYWKDNTSLAPRPFSRLPFRENDHAETPRLWMASERDPPIIVTTKEVKSESSEDLYGAIDHRDDRAPAPAGSFELSSSFFPEMYTSVMAAPTLVSYDLELVQETSYTRISRCNAFYSPSPRKWLRITFLITVSFDSPYWSLVRIDTADMKWGNKGWFLPNRLNASLQGSLCHFDDLKQDSDISFYLGPSHDQSGTYQPLKLQLEPTQSPDNFRKSLLEVTRIVHHWCCPRYSESDIVRRTLHPSSKRTSSVGYIGSQVTLLTQFMANQTDFDTFLYNMQISHCLHSKPGISRLLGLVYDQDSYLSGYLSEMATNPFLYYSREPKAQLSTVPWKRREKRCWQTVSMVASLHNSGFLAGTLADPLKSFVGADSNDDLLCRARFEQNFYYNEDTPFVVPPECKAMAIFDSNWRSLPATPSTDIYQLGIMLWRVANGLEVVLSSTLCGLAGCSTSPDRICREPHADPACLPFLDQEVPEYILHIIEICRSVNPSSREPAWRLLERFPSTTDRGWNHQPGESSAVPVNIDAWRMRLVYCDTCGGFTGEHYYHCSSCFSANFDICSDCFSKGAHCLNRDHLLQEMPNDMHNMWYTCVGANGMRDQRLLPDL